MEKKLKKQLPFRPLLNLKNLSYKILMLLSLLEVLFLAIAVFLAVSKLTIFLV